MRVSSDCAVRWPWRALTLQWLLGIAALGCTPDVPTDPLPEVAEFDPSSQPPRVPEPSFLLINPQTGRIDLRAAGITVPEDCEAQTSLRVAQCEFFQYLQGLDGFPTTARARATLTAPADPSTITVASSTGPGNVVLVEQNGRGLRSDVTATMATLPDGRGALEIAPRSGWTVGSFVWAGLRGYEAGLRATNGQRYVASVPYALLRVDQPLTCGAPNAEAIPAACPFLQLLLRSQPEAAARQGLMQLETVRNALRTRGAFTALETQGGLPVGQTAIVWGFPVHTASTIELDPLAPPQPSSATEIRLAVNGTVAPASLRPFAPGQPGTVLVLDLAALTANDLPNVVVPTTPSFEDGSIVLRTNVPFVAGRRYGLFVTTGVTNAQGAALVPSPITVALRARGALVGPMDASNVNVLSDAQAALLEPARQQLGALFDDPRWTMLTGLTRSQLAYVFVLTAR